MTPFTRAIGMTILVLVVLSLLMRFPEIVPWTVFVPVVMLAGVVVPPRYFVAVLLGVFAALGIAYGRLHDEKGVFVGSLVVILVVAALGFRDTVSRVRLGVGSSQGDAMLADLRDRLRANGIVPSLPIGWHADSAIQSAHGEGFSGDFAITALTADGGRFEVALVDVSGKGADAGTRALLLSGGFSGLLGVMPAEGFLPAANNYLLRQCWPEGFATAVHLSIDLATGAFSLGSAGHPPAVQFVAGSGRWQVLDGSTGPLLGVIEGAEYPRHAGRLDHGDALVLVTDGVIETPGRDLVLGIDRMLGAAEGLIRTGFPGGAARLCESARAGDTDDRAAVIVWRS